MKRIEAVGWYWPANSPGGAPGAAMLSVCRFHNGDSERGTVAIELDNGRSGRITLSKAAALKLAVKLLWVVVRWKR